MENVDIKNSGYNLHITKTDSFKTINIRMDYITKRTKKNSCLYGFFRGAFNVFN